MTDVLFVVNLAEWNVSTGLVAGCELGEVLRPVSVDFGKGSETALVLVQTWDRDTFRRVCVAVLSSNSGEASRDAAILGQLLSVLGPSVSLVALVGDSHVLRDTYVKFAGSCYRDRLVEYPIFDLRFLKRYLQKFCSVVFGRLDPFSMTEFINVRLKGAEHKDWMASQHALRRAILSGDLSILSLAEILGKMSVCGP